MRAISRVGLCSRKNTPKFDKLRDLVYVHSKPTFTGEQSRLIRSTLPAPEAVSDRYNAPLEYLQPTAAGMDGLPAWFLRVAAPIFYKTIAYLINMSLATSTIPR